MEEPQFTAVAGDVDGAIGVMRETAQWLIDAGMPLWEPGNLTREMLTCGLDSSSFLVFMAGAEPAAAMILQWKDTLFWPEVEENRSGFIHKLCVRRKYAGRGFPGKMMQYAIEQCRSKGLRFLRLDTDAGRPKLCNLYERLGFRFVRFTRMGSLNIALYEMEL